jgi:histidine triad (HIT) family protein
VPGEIVYQDETTIAIKDIHPLSPVHLVILPRIHLTSLADVRPEQMYLVNHLIEVAQQLAKKEGIAQKGYRVVINSGPDGDQAVPHLHVHLLGGRHLSGQLG